jgi:hypothetical protein
MGFPDLAVAIIVSVVLMLCLFVLSNVVLYRGLLPLSTAFPGRGVSRTLFYSLIMPGTVIHELSHFLACKLSRVRVFEVRLFDPRPDGIVGQVVYERCDPLRRNLIAFAPFLGGSAVLYLVTVIALPGPRPIDLARLAIRAEDPWASLGLALGAILMLLSQAAWDRPSTWLFLYLVFSVGYGIAPSRTDLSHLLADGAAGLVLCIVVVLADLIWNLGLTRSQLLNNVAAGVASLLQAMNSLLLFSAAIITLGALGLVPLAALMQSLRFRR